MPLLTRDEINIYRSFKLNEKAVEWDDSFLGALTKGLGNAFSWIGGKAAKGWKKMRLDSLVMQYGAEYVKALRAVDLNIDVNKDFPVDQAGAEFDSKPDDMNSTDSDQTGPAQDGTVDEPASDELKKDVAALEKLIILGLYDSEFKKHFTNKNMVNLNAVKKYLESFLDKIEYDDEVYLNKLNNVLKFNPADGILAAFTRLQFIIKTMWDLNEDSDLYQRLQNEYPKELRKLVPNESKWSELKSDMGNLVMGAVNKLAKYIYQCSKDMHGNKGQNSDGNKVQTESMINEANVLKIPKSVQELMPADDLAKFERIPGIKEKTLDKINTKALSTIKYEAEHIINKAKKKADYDMKSREGSTDADDLQREWEVGVKNVDNYFQKVIDVTKVADLVKRDLLPDDIKKTIEKTDEVVDMVPKLGIQSLSPVNAKFNNKGLYAFNINLRGQNNSVLKEAYIITSPTAEYIDAADDGKTYYWHKIFGQYKFDEKTNAIVRLNPFEKLTRSKAIIDNFKNKENQYFLVFESMRVSKKASNVWIYSNRGGAFYDGKVIPDVNSILEDVKRNNIQSWLSIGNLFRVIINARFTVDTNDLKRFPGIQQADILSEVGTKEAHANHDLIINNMPKK